MSKYKFKDDERMIDGIEIPSEKIRPFIDNEFVADFKGDKLYYTKDFDVALYKKIQEGMTYVEAYNALGFDTTVLGEERANAAGKRVMQKVRDNRLFTVDKTSYDGTVPREEMGELTAEEEMAYLKARNHYLEEMLLAQKKIRSELEAMYTS